MTYKCYLIVAGDFIHRKRAATSQGLHQELVPKRENNTRIHKFPMAIHIDPQGLLLLNKKCRYCVKCDLIIVKKYGVKSLIVAHFEKSKPEKIGNDYLVMGVARRKDRLKSKKGKTPQNQTIDRILVLKDILDFERV